MRYGRRVYVDMRPTGEVIFHEGYLNSKDAARAALAGSPAVSLRLMVAHAIAGSGLWQVRTEPQTCRNDLVDESIENVPGEADFDHMRRKAL